MIEKIICDIHCVFVCVCGNKCPLNEVRNGLIKSRHSWQTSVGKANILLSLKVPNSLIPQLTILIYCVYFDFLFLPSIHFSYISCSQSFVIVCVNQGCTIYFFLHRSLPTCNSHMAEYPKSSQTNETRQVLLQLLCCLIQKVNLHLRLFFHEQSARRVALVSKPVYLTPCRFNMHFNIFKWYTCKLHQQIHSNPQQNPLWWKWKGKNV